MLIDKVSKRNLLLIGLFLAALLVRSAVFFMYLKNDENYWQVDSNTYHVVAQQVAEGKGFTLDDGSFNFYRLPGYPAFLAFCYKFIGPDKVYALWVQLILASFIPVLIYFLAMVMFASPLLGALAGIFSVFHLGLVLYSGFFMTESIFLILFLLFLLIFLSTIHMFFCDTGRMSDAEKKFLANRELKFMYMPEAASSGIEYLQFYEKAFPHKPGDLSSLDIHEHDADPGKLFLAGIFLGLASLVRPVGHYAVVVAILLIILSNLGWLRKMRMALVFFIGWLLPVSFWLVRNYMLLGHLFFHTLPGGHFLYLSAARVAMHVNDCSYQQARDLLTSEASVLRKNKEDALGRTLNAIELCKLNEDLALKYFKQYPLLTLKNWTTDMFRTMFSLYSSEIMYLENNRQEYDYFNKNRSYWSMFERYLFPKTQNLFLKFLIWFEILIYLILLMGLIFSIVSICLCFFKFSTNIIAAENMCVLLKTIPWIAFFILLALSGGYARMRLPIEPIIIILSINFWLNFFKSKRIKSCNSIG